jgi:hypothetical protein
MSEEPVSNAGRDKINISSSPQHAHRTCGSLDLLFSGYRGFKQPGSEAITYICLVVRLHSPIRLYDEVFDQFIQVDSPSLKLEKTVRFAHKKQYGVQQFYMIFYT